VPLQVDLVGEALLEVGAPTGWGPVGLSEELLEQVLQRLQAAVGAVADIDVLRKRKAKKDDPGSPCVLWRAEHERSLLCVFQ
jgi:hypothetical protein